MLSVMKEARIDDLELVAEADAVFARFNHNVTCYDGGTTTYRGMAYYRLADGKIAANDVMFVPDLFQVLGALMTPPYGSLALCQWPLPSVPGSSPASLCTAPGR